MKKLGFILILLVSIISFGFKPAEAEYLPEYDQYVEVSYDQARYIADKLGMKGIPLGEETANLSFQVQESFVAQLEDLLNTEIDHSYIWLTVNGQKVLGIDPPVALPNPK